MHVAATNPAHDDSRRRAIADAHRRARAYAEAAGLALGDLVAIVEVDARSPMPPMHVPTQLAASRGGGPEMRAHSEGLELVATVDVTYELRPR